MRAEKPKRLEAKGWKVGSVKEFLDLSDQEAACSRLIANPIGQGNAVQPVACGEDGGQ
jgi:hypothetical protein